MDRWMITWLLCENKRMNGGMDVVVCVRESEYCTNRCQRTRALLHRRPTATAPSFLCKRFPNGDGSHGARVCPTLWPRPFTPQVSSSVISAAKQHSGLAQFAVLAPTMLRSPVLSFSRAFVCVVPRHYLVAPHALCCMHQHGISDTYPPELTFCLVSCPHSARATKTQSYCWTRLPSTSPLCRVSEPTHAPTHNNPSAHADQLFA